MKVSTRQFSQACLNATIYTLLALCALVTLLPFIYLACSAFKETSVFFTSPFLPIIDGGRWYQIDWDNLTARHFVRLLTEVKIGDAPFARAVFNSFYYAATLSLVATLGSAMGGYALAMMRFAGVSAATYLVLVCLVIPGSLLLAPGYVVLYHLGLLDTYAGLILPGAAPALGVYLFRQAFLASLPVEMLEAASIDGCGDLRAFFYVALPMVRPMVGAFLLITYLGAWNNFIGPQIILHSPEKFPLAVAVAQLRGNYGVEHGMIMAGTLIAILPILVLFLLLQSDFIAGLASGSVKG